MLKEELELYKSIFYNSAIGYVIYDKDYVIYKVNNTLAKIINKPRDEILGIDLISFISNDDVENFYDTIQILYKDKDTKNVDCIVRTIDKKHFIKIISNNMKLDGLDLIFSAVVDVTREQELSNKLEYLSFHDQLTGLYNRRFFVEELRRLDVKRNLPITIVMADVNNLKFINDTYGHANGDKLLRKVTKALKEGCREDDIVARIGGDEFVVLLPNTNSEDAKTIIGRIKDVLNKEKILSFDVSVSFGYSTKYDEKEDIRYIFKESEDFMYREKLQLKAGNR